MYIYEIDTNRYAMGKPNKLAKAVVITSKGKAFGVRGRKPKLDDRFKRASVPAYVKAKLTELAE